LAYFAEFGRKRLGRRTRLQLSSLID
jgi:hypothetical protein